TGGHRGRGVRGSAAARRLPGGAAVSAAPRTRASAFAPASVGNVAIGFDILGFAVEALGDRVTVTSTAAPGVTISAVRGIVGELPQRAEDNTAGRALLAMQEALQPKFGFTLEIDKGIPLGSGLGGSAASAVAAVMAANALLAEPCGQLELLRFAMAGEAVASGARHVVIEPQRQALIPGFADVRRGAMAAGALGCSISGAGPSMFAWALEAAAPKVLAAMREAFARHSLATDEWVVELRSNGARVIG